MKHTQSFKLIKKQYIKELKTEALFYRHNKNGAEVLSLINDDENKVFGITFRTPPEDSTGIAHILEHSVLCGSRKYPVKEPFVELLKGSLQTFLNAFTYPDKTCYPVASQNLQDFYNLIDVYLDSVFYPRLTPFIFQQEGWHYEIDETNNALIYKGVVFNEMKGAYSSPDSLLSSLSGRSLFPDTTYGLDSGGEPKHIPGLTFEALKAFHQKYYHPSNACIYFYGDDSPEERLNILNKYLKDFDKQDTDSSIRLQPQFKSPLYVEHPFASGETDSKSPKGMVTVSWLLSETTEVVTNLALIFLEYILLGMPASPLRKALIDSRLGEGLAGIGLENELRQMYFSTGLKGIDINNAKRVEELILETLTGLVRDKIDPLTIEAAANTIEFHLREKNTGSFPRGLSQMLLSLTTWLYDADPLSLLAFEEPLEKIKAEIASNPSYFEDLIEKYFLNNPHRTTLILKPNPELGKKQLEEETKRLSDIRSDLKDDDIQQIIKNNNELKKLQETPDTPDALAAIPTLRLSDLDKMNKIIPLARQDHRETQIYYHDLFTNRILYLDVGLNLHTLPQKYIPMIPLFGQALLEMGTEKEDFVRFSQRISRKTGGIRRSYFTSPIKNSDIATTWMFMRCKSMLHQADELFSILKDMLLMVQLDNQERFRQIALEAKTRRERSLIPQGSRIVNLRMRAHFNEADWANELMNGISSLFFLRELTERIDNDWPGVLTELEEMKRILVNQSALIVNATIDEKNWSGCENHLIEFLNALPKSQPGDAPWSPEMQAEFEGMIMPSKVNFVGKGTNLYDLGYTFHGSAYVITRFLRTTWFWERVRMQGGAYGAMCNFDQMSGILSFLSYRDPNLIKTIDIFDETANFLKTARLTDDELTKCIIGVIGDIDSYLLPDAKGYASMLRTLNGNTDNIRQRTRDEVLETNESHFRAFADIITKFKDEGIVKVLGGQDALNDAVSSKKEWLTLLKIM